MAHGEGRKKMLLECSFRMRLWFVLCLYVWKGDANVFFVWLGTDKGEVYFYSCTKQREQKQASSSSLFSV